MGSYICYQTWSGGSGANDPRIEIGYCKEDPIEVLKTIARTHDVYHFGDLYRPLNYGCNVTGLYISKAEAPKGCKITASLSDLDLSIAKTKVDMTDDRMLYALGQCKKWHTYRSDTKRSIKLTEQYHKQIDELVDMVKNGKM